MGVRLLAAALAALAVISGVGMLFYSDDLPAARRDAVVMYGTVLNGFATLVLAAAAIYGIGKIGNKDDD